MWECSECSCDLVLLCTQAVIHSFFYIFLLGSLLHAVLMLFSDHLIRSYPVLQFSIRNVWVSLVYGTSSCSDELSYITVHPSLWMLSKHFQNHFHDHLRDVLVLFVFCEWETKTQGHLWCIFFEYWVWKKLCLSRTPLSWTSCHVRCIRLMIRRLRKGSINLYQPEGKKKKSFNIHLVSHKTSVLKVLCLMLFESVIQISDTTDERMGIYFRLSWDALLPPLIWV